MGEIFSPTLSAAHARIAAVQPQAYARTRNALDGAVSHLSPYITHGFVSLPEVLAGVTRRDALNVQHRFVYELGWRAYFRHVWLHRGEEIFKSLHQGPLPEGAYLQEVPIDICQACTGVAVVDEAVRTLYATGTLHNHARMWLASYVVHVRKVHWRSGADWLYSHLLDGDLGSNHLSWQWVAGTSSNKPYLFNADNVARYAPAQWHSRGSVIDQSYEALAEMARQPLSNAAALSPAAPRPDLPTPEPALFDRPPDDWACMQPQSASVAGRDVWLVHPWKLAALPAALPPNVAVIGLMVAEFHSRWPWSAQRWNFVCSRMAQMTSQLWHGSTDAIGQALQQARSVRSTEEPHLAPWLSQWAQCEPELALFDQPERCCASFSTWWGRVTRGFKSSSELLGNKGLGAS